MGTIITCGRKIGAVGKGGGGFWSGKRFESGDGTTLNTSKWTVTNPTTTAAEFEQRNAVVMHSLNGTNTGAYANRIKSSDSRALGVWWFSMLDIQTVNAPLTPNVNFFRAIGLIDSTTNNSIEFYRDNTYQSTLRLRIRQSGSEVYTVDSGVKDLANVKITIDGSHVIKIYKWVNDAYVQIGTDQTYDLGSLSLFMSTKGYDWGKSAIRDVYISNADERPTEIPDSVTVSAIDVRDYGAVPDGTTDSAEAINDALAVGNIIIKDGEFLISDSIIIPSNRTVYIKNARIKMDDESYINIIRFFDTYNVLAEDVKVIGLGNAVLDGNVLNNDDDYATHGTSDVTIDAMKYVSIYLNNVDGFEIKSLNIVDYMHWCFFTRMCDNGLIDDIFLSYGFETHNQDGFDIAADTHNITLSNIRAMTDDDALGLFASKNTPASAIGGGVSNITVENFKSYYTPARAIIFCGEGTAGCELTDITIRNYKSYSAEYGFLCGLTNWYTLPPAADDVKDITFENCEFNVCTSNPIRVIQNCENIYFTDFVNNSGKADFYMPSTKEVNDFNINGVSYPTPVVFTATVEDTAKDDIVLTFNTKMDQTITPDVSAFAVDGKTVSGVTWYSEKVLIVTVSVAFANGNTIVIDYTKPVSNPITNLYGEEVATFADQSVTNNIIAEFPANLLAHWKFNGDVTDSSGNGYDLSNTGAALTTDRNSGSNKAYELGNTDVIKRATFTEAKLNEFTVCGWFKAGTLSNADNFVGHLLETSFGSGWGVIYVTGTSSLRFFVNNWNSQVSGHFVDIAFSDTTNWHFFCASYKKTATSANMRFSIDDGDEVTTDYTSNVDYGSCDFQIGRTNLAAQNFKSDGIALFSRELSAAERTFMYNYED